MHRKSFRRIIWKVFRFVLFTYICGNCSKNLHFFLAFTCRALIKNGEGKTKTNKFHIWIKQKFHKFCLEKYLMLYKYILKRQIKSDSEQKKHFVFERVC